MKEFSLEGFVAHLGAMPLEIAAAEHEALERAGKIVQAEAKAEVGTYQDQAGPFAGWEELAQSTKDQRVALGYTENDPGLRSGEMRDSIEMAVVGNEAHVGSDDDKMVFFELGTSKQPPRSVLGGSLVRKTDEVIEVMGESMVSALIGEGVHKGRLNLRGDVDNQ